MNLPHRYAELDWLRVILIVAVFLHHVGMPFNGDGFHIQNPQSSKLLDDIMVYFEQFRMPLLFLIAGCSSTLVLNVKQARSFIKGRLIRLLLPLVFAVLFIVPPQIYIENIAQYDSYLSAWPELALKLQSNHLWFIEFLLFYALLSVAVHSFLQTSLGNSVLNVVQKLTKNAKTLLIAGVFVVAFYVVLKVFYPDSDKTLFNLSITAYYGFYYLLGMLLIARKHIWRQLAEHRQFNLVALMVSSVLFYGYYFAPDLSAYLPVPQLWMIWWAMSAIVTWTGALTILGFAQHYLNRSNAWLKPVNTMIYPFYILHQTFIVVIAYPIIQWDASIAFKMLSLLVLSFAATALSCALFIYPFNWVRGLFGVKPLASTKHSFVDKSII